MNHFIFGKSLSIFFVAGFLLIEMNFENFFIKVGLILLLGFTDALIRSMIEL